jgi:hypothetical protein
MGARITATGRCNRMKSPLTRRGKWTPFCPPVPHNSEALQRDATDPPVRWRRSATAVTETRMTADQAHLAGEPGRTIVRRPGGERHDHQQGRQAVGLQRHPGEQDTVEA